MASGTKRGAKKGSSTARSLSTLLYIISAALIVVVVVLYFKDRGAKTQAPPTPASIPGQNQLINVVEALSAQGVTAKAAQGGASADQFTPPGQYLDLGGTPLYVFVYDNPDDRAADSDAADPANLTLTTLAGTPVPPSTLKMFSGSNIIAVLAGGDDSLSAKVEAAVKALP